MTMMNVHGILACEIAFCKTEIMDRVEQVGLAHPVAAANTDDPLRKLKVVLKVIFKLIERYGTQVKAQDV